MLKAAIAVVFVIAINRAQAGSDEYYECTRTDGFVEYSLYPCEAGQEQRKIGSREEPRSYVRKKPRQARPAAESEQRQVEESKITKEYTLATYKCVGKSGDILFTDARDYLAFATYRCKQISLGMACAEARDLKTKDPLAVVSNKLPCP